MDMVERVARAIDPQAFDGRYPTTYPPQNIIARDRFLAGERRQKKARKQARAVLAALREPTEAMIAAADNLNPGSGLPYEPGSPAQVWRAMIDAAEGR